jgi:hypothetical protein
VIPQISLPVSRIDRRRLLRIGLEPFEKPRLRVMAKLEL